MVDLKDKFVELEQRLVNRIKDAELEKRQFYKAVIDLVELGLKKADSLQ